MSDELLQAVEAPVSENVEIQDQVVESIDEGLGADQENEEQEEKKREPPWFQKRINQLNTEMRKHQRDSEQYQRMLIQQQELIEQLRPKQPEPQGLVEPRAEEFPGGQYDPRYQDARLAYIEAKAEERAAQRVEAEFQRREQMREQAELHSRIQTAEAAARGKYADYDEAINGLAADPQLAANPVIRQALFGTDQGAEIGYLLGKNLDVAYEIAQSRNPILAGMKLAELMHRAPRKQVNAPPTPIKPIGGAAGSPVSKPLDQMSTEEYIRHMNAIDLQKRQARFAGR